MTREPTINLAGIALTAPKLKALLLGAAGPPDLAHGEIESAADASQILAALGRQVGTPADGLLEEAVGRHVSVVDLYRIKETAKLLLIRADYGTSRHAALLLYLVAIGAAYARYGVEISRQPLDEYLERFDQLADRFQGFVLGEVFQQAADRVRKDRPDLAQSCSIAQSAMASEPRTCEIPGPG